MTIATAQQTAPGTLVVTVARDGTRCANTGQHSYPIWVTAIYEARARQSDGTITWRRVDSLGVGTSGYGVTGPMRDAAVAVAAERGLECRAGIRHGDVCN